MMILRRHLVQTAASAAAASASANRSCHLLTTSATAYTAPTSCRRYASSSSSSGNGNAASSTPAASSRSSSSSRDHEPPPYITNGAPPPKVLRSLASAPSSSSTASKAAKPSAPRSASPSPKSTPAPSTSNLASDSAAQIETNSAKFAPALQPNTLLSNTSSELPPAGKAPLPSYVSSTSPPAEGASTPKAPVTLWSRAKSAYETLKFLFLFYWNGVKQIFRNRTRVKEIQARVAKPDGRALSREESQLIRMHNSDMRKLPLFLAIVLILEELLPLVVIYAPGLLPSTCILPSQLTKIRGKEEDRRKEAVRRLRELSSSLTIAPAAADGAAVQGSANTWEEEVKQAVSALNPSAVKDLALTFKLATWGGSFMQRKRLSSHLLYLREDDALMAGVAPDGANGGTGSTSVADEVPQDVDGLTRACSERGLRASGVDSVTMSEALRTWLGETRPAHGAPAPSASELLQLPLRLYDSTPVHRSSLPNASQEASATTSPPGSGGVLAEAKAVAQEVVEAEREILERDRRAQEEIKRKMEQDGQQDALPKKPN